MATAENVFVFSFGGGMLLGAAYILIAAVYAHRHIKTLDQFARGWTWKTTDFLVFKVLRLGVYAMASAWPFASRRLYPGKDFSELSGRMPMQLTVLFWWFVVAFGLMLFGMAIMFLLLEPLD